MTVEEIAMGFIRVANEAMCRPIRALTQVLGILFCSLVCASCMSALSCLRLMSLSQVVVLATITTTNQNMYTTTDANKEY